MILVDNFKIYKYVLFELNCFVLYDSRWVCTEFRVIRYILKLKTFSCNRQAKSRLLGMNKSAMTFPCHGVVQIGR